MTSPWLAEPDPALTSRIPADLPSVPDVPMDSVVAAVQVFETEEPLVELPETLAVRHGYRELPLQQTPTRLLLRHSVVNRLESAQNMLPEGMRLLILDGWRSVAFQTELLEYYRQQTGRNLDGYVADPTDAELISPHTTGGAVDLTLMVDGEALALGTDWDSFSSLAAVDALEQAETAMTAPLRLARDLRRILADVMIRAGFGPFPTEWWHWSHGDQRWAAFSGQPRTLYAPLQREVDAGGN